jgi:DNA-binding response OmpR family regulator
MQEHSTDVTQSFEFKSILLVDDDRQLADALQWNLADRQFMVDVVYDGAEALEKIREQEYDIVVCDVMLPSVKGPDLYREARQLRPSLRDRFIFVTGHTNVPLIAEFLAQTKSRYLMKPFLVDTLVNFVEEVTSQN